MLYSIIHFLISIHHFFEGSRVSVYESLSSASLHRFIPPYKMYDVKLFPFSFNFFFSDCTFRCTHAKTRCRLYSHSFARSLARSLFSSSLIMKSYSDDCGLEKEENKRSSFNGTTHLIKTFLITKRFSRERKNRHRWREKF